MKTKMRCQELCNESIKVKIRFTLSRGERMLHQKSQADALNSSFDEYNTNKPNDEHINNIK
jgi:hypothetical protein